MNEYNTANTYNKNSQDVYEADSTRLARVDRLRKMMRHLNLDALIITRTDEHLSEYLSPDRERLAYITGFTGSAGTAVILENEHLVDRLKDHSVKNSANREIFLKNSAAIFVDGRYTIQAKIQTSPTMFDVFHFTTVKLEDWLITVLGSNARIGIDPKCISYNRFTSIKSALAPYQLELISTETNLIDDIWNDKPKYEPSPALIFEDHYNGNPSIEKRHLIAQILKEKNIDVTIISSSESVNWLLNIRGRDIPNLPVVKCFAAVYSCEEIEWFVDLRKIPENRISDFQHHFGNITYMEEDKLEDLINRLAKHKYSVYIDETSTNAWIIEKLKKSGIPLTFGPDLCEYPKACKNPTELKGMKRCHHKDAVAMCRFLSWLDHLTENLINASSELKPQALEIIKAQNEATLSKQLLKFREEQDGFIETSFDTISALGPNAAIIHYNHVNLNKPRALGQDPLYLVDSGGQYNEGTTDITRTVLVGPGLTDEMKERFTLVLKGMIALHQVRFPKGTFGGALDVLARAPLWQKGLNYDHGTGHGVGHCLNVHEGPQAISYRYGQTPLAPGMVTSVEPGYYKENEYGIRCENLCVVETVHDTQNQAEMLAFLPITYVPFDIRLIKKELLTDDERTWLNNYHLKVREIVREHLSDLEINWLLKATAAI